MLWSRGFLRKERVFIAVLILIASKIPVHLVIL